jgi:anti-sigma factor RsiW
MQCKQIQELILTDYLDKRMNREQRKQLEAHLTGCSHCKEFEAMARRTVIEPLKNAERVEPPEALWHQIKEQIEQQEQGDTNPFVDLIVRIKSFLHIPKPVFAAATIMAALLIAVVMIKSAPEKGEIPNLKLKEQIEYMAYLAEGSDQLSLDQDEDYGTSIEEYFL